MNTTRILVMLVMVLFLGLNLTTEAAAQNGDASMVSVQEAEQLVAEYWNLLNSNDSSGLSSMSFAPTYTYQGQPASAEPTAHGMSALFSTFSYYHFYILDLFGEQKNDQVKVVIRWMLHATLKEGGAKHEAMATNIVSFDVTGLISNWQTGFRGMQDATPVDYYIAPKALN